MRVSRMQTWENCPPLLALSTPWRKMRRQGMSHTLNQHITHIYTGMHTLFPRFTLLISLVENLLIFAENIPVIYMYTEKFEIFAHFPYENSCFGTVIV